MHCHAAENGLSVLILPVTVTAMKELGRLAALGQSPIFAAGAASGPIRNPVSAILVDDAGKARPALAVDVSRMGRLDLKAVHIAVDRHFRNAHDLVVGADSPLDALVADFEQRAGAGRKLPSTTQASRSKT